MGHKTTSKYSIQVVDGSGSCWWEVRSPRNVLILASRRYPILRSARIAANKFAVIHGMKITE